MSDEICWCMSIYSYIKLLCCTMYLIDYLGTVRIMVVISAYHHQSCNFESRSWQDVLDTTLCDKVCQWLVTGRWIFSGYSSTNKTDHHYITEILLKVVLNTITITLIDYFNHVRNLRFFSIGYLFRTSIQPPAFFQKVHR